MIKQSSYSCVHTHLRTVSIIYTVSKTQTLSIVQSVSKIQTVSILYRLHVLHELSIMQVLHKLSIICSVSTIQTASIIQTKYNIQCEYNMATASVTYTVTVYIIYIVRKYNILGEIFCTAREIKCNLISLMSEPKSAQTCSLKVH